MEDNKKFESTKVDENYIYQFIVNQWMHQNQLSWNRINVILALETAVLAGSFTIKGCIGSFLILVGTVVGLIMYQLMKRDWEIRDQNLKLLDSVHLSKEIRMIVPHKKDIQHGKWLLDCLFIIFLITNIIAFIYLIVK